MVAAARPYRGEPDRHLWDLLEHLYEEGAWRVEGPWAPVLWELLGELSRRLEERDGTDLNWLRERLERRRLLLEHTLGLLADQPPHPQTAALVAAVEVELLEGAVGPGFPAVRPSGYGPTAGPTAGPDPGQGTLPV